MSSQRKVSVFEDEEEDEFHEEADMSLVGDDEESTQQYRMRKIMSEKQSQRIQVFQEPEDREEEEKFEQYVYEHISPNAKLSKRLFSESSFSNGSSSRQRQTLVYDENEEEPAEPKRRRVAMFEDSEVSEIVLKKQDQIDESKQRIEEILQQLENERRASKELTIKLEFEKKKREACEAKLKENNAESKNTVSMQQNQLREEVSQLQSKLQQMEKAYTQKLRLAVEDTKKVQLQLDDVKEKNTSLSSQSKNLESALLQKDLEINSLKAEVRRKEEEAKKIKNQELLNHKHQMELMQQKYEEVQAQNKQLLAKIEDYAQMETMNKHLKEEVKALKDFKYRCEKYAQENEDLKKKVDNVHILKERLLSMEEKISKLDELEEQTTQFQTDKLKLEQQLQELLDGRTVEEAKGFKDKLQQDNIQLTMQRGRLTTEKDKLESEYKRTVDRNKELELEIVKLSTELSKTRELMRMKENNMVLMSKENEDRKNLLHSYDQEYALVTNDTAKLKRIEELEKLLGEKNDQIRKLEEKCEQITESYQSFNQKGQKTLKEVELLTSANTKLKAELSQYKKQVEGLELEVAKYEHRLGKGIQDYNVQTTKILHLSVNPQTQAKAQQAEKNLESYKAEIKILQERVKELEQKLATGVTKKTEEEIQKVKADYEKTMERLKQIFQQKSTSFRRAVYLLFGFKMDFIGDTQYKLSSMYAESEDDVLMFEYDEKEKKMKLMATEFAESLRDSEHIIDYLEKHESFPAFLSAVTTDLFTKQTIFQK